MKLASTRDIGGKEIRIEHRLMVARAAVQPGETAECERRLEIHPVGGRGRLESRCNCLRDLRGGRRAAAFQ
jgi:hypothetical protein